MITNPITTFHLQLDIPTDAQLNELTAMVNGICEQAEEQNHAVIVFRFITNVLELTNWPGQVSIQDVNRWERAIRRVERLRAAVIAMVTGTIGGPAVELLLATDHRIATQDLRLCMPVNDGHIWPGMAIHRLVNQVGLARARQLIMRMHDVSAQWALDVGLVDEITDDTQSALRAAVARMAKMPSAEIAVRRQLLLEATTTTYEDALGTYLAACDRELRRLRGQ